MGPSKSDILSATASNSVPANEVFAFIFKVETGGKNHYVVQVNNVSTIVLQCYHCHILYSQSSLRDVLDLSEFSCMEVTLSLAVVNQIGSSNFTAYLSPLHVHGGVCIEYYIFCIRWQHKINGTMAIKNRTLVVPTHTYSWAFCFYNHQSTQQREQFHIRNKNTAL